MMQKIEAVSNKTAELINSGIELSSNTIQYTYSNLPSLKQSLIEKATQDASERANKIVNTADGSIGKLKTASMGVFQITGQGSTEEDSYGGINDIYSKNKTAGNDPYISRRMRYSQIVRGRKYTTVRNFQFAVAKPLEKLPAHLFPKGQIYGLENRP